MNSLPVTSESKLSAAMSNYTCYAKKHLPSTVKKICVEDKVIEELFGSKSSLWDQHELQQSVNDLVGRGPSTQRRRKHRKNSSKHKHHMPAGTGEEPFVCKICGDPG